MKTLIFSFFAILLSTAVFAQDAIYVKVTPNEYPEEQVDEMFSVRYTANRSGAEWIIPEPEHFKVLAVTKGSTIRMIGGETKALESRTMHIIPLKKGTFTIPSMMIIYENDTIKSDPVKVIVKPSTAPTL